MSGFLDGLFGRKETVPTRRGAETVRRGGLPGRLAALAGGTANLPLVGPVVSEDAPAVSEASAIHEGEGHERGKGALYDLVSKLRGHGTPSGLDPAYWRPSEIYAYTTQPADLSGDEMRNVYGLALQQQPELAEYFARHRNPASDWPDPAAARMVATVNRTRR